MTLSLVETREDILVCESEMQALSPALPVVLPAVCPASSCPGFAGCAVPARLVLRGEGAGSWRHVATDGNWAVLGERVKLFGTRCLPSPACLQAHKGLAAGIAAKANLCDRSPPTPSRFAGTLLTSASSLEAFSLVVLSGFGVAM